MRFFVIQQKSTGFLFPRRNGAQTHAEFQSGGTPRLFPSKIAARYCLTWWLKGATVVTRTGGGMSFEGEWDGIDESWEITPRPDRKADDYEIVETELSLVPVDQPQAAEAV